MYKLSTDRVLIQGLVTIWQGDKVIVKQAPNSWVDAGLKGLTSALLCDYLGIGIYDWARAAVLKMYLGSDTTTITTHGMLALITPIGSAPGTAPDSIDGENLTNPSSGTFTTSITAIWYAGNVSGTVGELALYMGAFTNLTPEWNNDRYNYPSLMVSRLSNADEDFSSFVIDTGISLTVEWEIRAVFA